LPTYFNLCSSSG